MHKKEEIYMSHFHKRKYVSNVKCHCNVIRIREIVYNYKKFQRYLHIHIHMLLLRSLKKTINNDGWFTLIINVRNDRSDVSIVLVHLLSHYVQFTQKII